MKIRVITFFTYTCLTFLGVPLFAQMQDAATENQMSKKKDVILGVNLTGTGYYGDINYMDPQDPNASLYFSLKPGVGASVGFEGFSLVQPAINFGYGAFVAQNPDLKPEPIRNGADVTYIKPTKYINTSFIYTDLAMRFTPIRKMSVLDPYMMLGVGGLYFTPRKVDGTKVGGNTRNKYSPIAASIPFSLGTELRLNKRLSLNMGLTARFPLTDNMDNSGDNELGAFNRQQGNDRLFGFNFGANYRLLHRNQMQSIAAVEPKAVQPNPALAKPASEVLKPTTRGVANPPKPATFSIPEDQKLPKSESLILATTIDLRDNPTYMAMFEWKTEEPQALPALFTEMVQTTDCDSIAKLFDLRLANLNNENQQLRQQYTKLSQETQKLREENEMFAAKVKVIDEYMDSKSTAKKNPENNVAETPSNSVQSSSEALRKANESIDSLTRQISTLQLAMTNETSERQKMTGALDSLASISQEKDAMIAELKEKLKEAGTQTTAAPQAVATKPTIDENSVALQNELMARTYTRKIDSLSSLVTRLERQYRMIKNDADILKGQKSVLEDRIQQANKLTAATPTAQPSEEANPEVAHYTQSIDSLVKENQYLQAQLSEIKIQAARKEADYMKEIAGPKETNSIDSLLDILAGKENEYTALYREYLSLKQQGTSATVNPEVQTRIAEMQKQFEDLLASYSDMQKQRDSYQQALENERAKQAIVTQDPAAALSVLIARTQHRVDSMNSYYAAVQQRIEGYEVTINRLRNENDSMAVALNQRTSGSGEPVVMAATESPNNYALQRQVEDYRTQVQDMGNEIQAYKTQLAEMTDKVRAILEQRTGSSMIDKQELDTKIAELEGQLKVSEAKVVELAAENDALKAARTSQPEVESYQGAIAAMQQQIDEKETAIKQLEGENRTYREENEQLKKEDKSVALAEKLLALEDANAALIEENVKLKADATTNIITSDTQILNDRITQLTAENEALRRVNQTAGESQVKLEEMNDKYAKMEAEYNEMKEVVARKTETTLPIERVKDMETEIRALREEKDALLSQLADRGTELETAKEKNKELEVAASTRPQPNEELQIENERLKTERKALDVKLAELEAKGTQTDKSEEVQRLTDELAVANEKIATLTQEKAEIAAKLADLQTQPTTTPTVTSSSSDELARLQEDYAAAEKKIAALEQEKTVLLAQIEAISENGGEIPTLKAQVADLKAIVKQLQDEKLAAETNTASTTAMMPDNESQEKIAELTKERDELKVALEQEKANVRVASTAPVSDAETQLAAAKEQVSLLTEQLAVANQQVADLKAQPSTPTTSNEVSMKLAQVETERDAIQKQLEENTQYISKVLQEKDEMQRKAEVAEKRVSMLETEVADLKQTGATPTTNVATDELAEKDTKIAILNERLAVLQEELEKAKTQGSTNTSNVDLLEKIGELERMVASQKEELTRKNNLVNSGDMSAQLANMDMREKKLAQRENYLALKEEEIRRNEAKFEYLNAKEIELKLLEQRVSGFYAISEAETHEGAPCAYTTATLEKEEVLQNLDDYFLGLGYSYTLDAGKLVYNNVVIPEISNKPMNISFYMRTSQTGKRTLQGVFRYTTGVYITEDKYPAEYIKVLKFLQRIAQ